jgi:hypothetical protein
VRILLLAPGSGTSLHRLHALERLGHDVHRLDYRPDALKGRIAHVWTHKTGGLGSSALVMSHLVAGIGSRRYDVAIVDGGELVGPEHIRLLKTVARSVISFNQDNPYVDAEGRRWHLFRRAVSSYDLVVTARATSAAAAREAGAKRVLHVTFAADEVVHRRPEPPPERNLVSCSPGPGCPAAHPS